MSVRLFIILVVAALCAACELTSENGVLRTTAHVAGNVVNDARLTAQFKVTSDWGSGFGAELELSNPGPATVTDWRIEFDADQQLTSVWNAKILSHVGKHYVLGPEAWNAQLVPGEKTALGCVGAPGGLSAPPSEVVVTPVATQPVPAPAPTGTASPAPAASASPAPTPTASPAPTPAPSAPIASYRVVNDWGSGLQAEVTVQNPHSQALKDWTVQLDLAVNITSIWNAEVAERTGNQYRFRPASWMAELPPGGSASFGFVGSPAPATTPSPTSSPSPTPTTTPTRTSTTGQKLVAYFPEWGIYSRNYQVTDIPADKIEVLNYAFANISPEGEITTFDSGAASLNFPKLRQLKTRHPKLVVMLAVGGWTLSGRFSDVAATPQARRKFAQSAVRFLEQHGFDGLDVDWEYPVGGGLESNRTRPEDKQNYTLLMRELKAQFAGRYLLSAAMPAGYDKIANLEPQGLSECCDWLNLMTYDFHGGWENRTGHQPDSTPTRRTPRTKTTTPSGPCSSTCWAACRRKSWSSGFPPTAVAGATWGPATTGSSSGARG